MTEVWALAALWLGLALVATLPQKERLYTTMMMSRKGLRERSATDQES